MSKWWYLIIWALACSGVVFVSLSNKPPADLMDIRDGR